MSKSNLIKLAALGLFLALAVQLLVRRQGHVLEPGDVAPSFALLRLDGGEVSLDRYRQQVVILNFWATWCPPCVEEMPSLELLAEQTRDFGVVVIAVSVDREQAALKKFLGGSYPTLLVAYDPSRAVARRYGTYKYPETYIINRDGKITRRIVGAYDWKDPQILDYIRKLTRAASQSQH